MRGVMLGPEAEQVMRELSHDLMSPYCPGRTIATCPSQQARKLEQDILTQAEEGATREEIEEVLVGRFGADIRGYEGDPVVIYGSAVVALVAAGLLAYLGRNWVRRPRPAAAGATASAAAASPAELDAIEDALDDIDEF